MLFDASGLLHTINFVMVRCQANGALKVSHLELVKNIKYLSTSHKFNVRKDTYFWRNRCLGMIR